MATDERNITPDGAELPKPVSLESLSSDEVRFAPPIEPEAQPDTVQAAEKTETQITEASVEESESVVTDGMDIEAALAAVSSLSDMLAEQEAAEQARLAQVEAKAQAAAERQARLESPELFFPVPPMPSLNRGQMTSVLPALLLIATGAWLTFTLTTTKAPPDPLITTEIVAGGIGLGLVMRWLSSGRWARGSLFFGVLLILSSGSIFYLSQPTSPGWRVGWPLLLITLGAAFFLAGVFSIPRNRSLVLPGLIFIVGGAAGFVITLGVLSSEVATTIGTLWPGALVLVVILLGLPLIFRQRG
jgi:hypothetical protein